MANGNRKRKAQAKFLPTTESSSPATQEVGLLILNFINSESESFLFDLENLTSLADSIYVLPKSLSLYGSGPIPFLGFLGPP